MAKCHTSARARRRPGRGQCPPAPGTSPPPWRPCCETQAMLFASSFSEMRISNRDIIFFDKRTGQQVKQIAGNEIADLRLIPHIGTFLRRSFSDFNNRYLPAISTIHHGKEENHGFEAKWIQNTYLVFHRRRPSSAPSWSGNREARNTLFSPSQEKLHIVVV